MTRNASVAGVQVHAAHGYLLSQFLSPLVNQRTDNCGGSVEKRMRMLIEIVRAVASVTPQSFLLTVKMNVSDFQPGGLDAAKALIVAKTLENDGVHTIEFSGGTYESSAMIDGGVARDSSGARETRDAVQRIPQPHHHDRRGRVRCGRCDRAGHDAARPADRADPHAGGHTVMRTGTEGVPR